MTPLRQRMLDAMVLRGFAQRTQETYLGAVIRMAQHYDCSPDLLSDELAASVFAAPAARTSPISLHCQPDLMRGAIFCMRRAGPNRTTRANPPGP